MNKAYITGQIYQDKRNVTTDKLSVHYKHAPPFGQAMDDDTVGTRIETARRHKGWTQADLATATFTTQTCISYWEGDKRAITVHDLLIVASALDVPPAELIPDDTPTPQPPPALDLTSLTNDLREILDKLEKTMTGPTAVVGWVVMPTQTCDTRTGRHWHLFLHLKTGTSLRIGGLHFNTEPEAVTWGATNLRLRHVTVRHAKPTNQ